MWRNKKGKIRRVWKIGLVFLLILYFLPLASRLIPFGMDAKETAAFFEKKNIAFTDTVISVHGQKVRYVCTGPDTGRMVVFIHGSPGSWSDLKEYLCDSLLLSKGFRLVALDRPGYGKSDGPGFSRLQDQAVAVWAIVQQRKNPNPAVVVGHSYGGPVAVKLATMYPTDVGGLLLVSPTVAPNVEEHISVKRMAQDYSRMWAFRWMMDDMLVHSTNEMKPLPEEVRKMEKDYSQVTCPVIEMHGTKDWMAPFENQNYIGQMLRNAKVENVTIPEGDHFLIWSMQPKVVGLVNQLANGSDKGFSDRHEATMD
jgi:pimeloyl-ACP methyl ester carboxylesterase